MNYNELINELNQNISDLTKEEKDIIDAEQKLQEKKLQVIKTKNANQTRLRFLKLIERPDLFFNNSKVLSLIASLEKIEDNQSKENKTSSSDVLIEKNKPDTFYGDRLSPEQLKGGSISTQHIKYAVSDSNETSSNATYQSSGYQTPQEVLITADNEFPDDLADLEPFSIQNDDESKELEEEKNSVRAKIKK